MEIFGSEKVGSGGVRWEGIVGFQVLRALFTKQESELCPKDDSESLKETWVRSILFIRCAYYHS